MIINLTQHPASPDQIAAGVVDCGRLQLLQQWLTFESLPTRDEIEDRAGKLANLARAEIEATFNFCGWLPRNARPFAYRAMIGGAPYLMAPLERELRKYGIEPVYAFSLRESLDQPQADGSVRKINVFLHAGFVSAEA